MAIELTPHSIRTYVNGVVCDDHNAFTEFVSAYNTLLRQAYSDMAHTEEDAVVLVGRWHRPELEGGVFDGYQIHVVNERGIVSRPYDAEIFDHDLQQTAMTIKTKNGVDTKFIEFLRNRSTHLTKSMISDLTEFGIPHVDGVAWLPDDHRLPVIVCDLDWPEGLDRDIAMETLDLAPSPRRNNFSSELKEVVTLGEAMLAACIPMYFFQIRLGEAEPDDPAPRYFKETECHHTDLLLRRIDIRGEDGLVYASDWQQPDDDISYRILV
ncbi:MAG: hypothetical protein V7774_07855 [Pseudorhizobium pelagicum]|uniref:hypothetical protein n=1 Tax=Pseudorhizobium pelagicum TaxID=1509405 RepID=UPI00345F5F0A